ncbi:LTA synthase family protein [Paenibacillus sp. JCM 10914]|uniref:LTA synthase family protein n=1 Tax=Paenibacillus sp. JCM 10914 TaxID=1236974 RepID=UPI0003CC392B|nr:LTA synthase family protein [Paenibacillus sp. JCM 10914]GAE05472.1 lipoteichoic acid primase LtaP [Paenibacillus sp. JCM 10914]
MERTLGQRLRIVLPLFFILLLKLMLLRYFLFNGIAWAKVFTDALSLAVLFSLLELCLPHKGKKLVYGCVNLILSLMMFASAVYNVHFGSIPTYTTLAGIGQVNQVKASIVALIEPEHFLFFVDLVIMLVVWLVLKIRSRSRRGLHFGTLHSYSRTSWRTARTWKLSMLIVLVVSVAASGLIIRKEWGIDNEIARAEQMGYLNYQVATVLRNSQENRAIAEGNLQETKERVRALQDTYSYVEQGSARDKYHGVAAGSHVLIVQMESLQNFPIGLSVSGQELTPVMNQLVEEGLYFPHIFQQIGQGNTSDAEFAVNTSIYPTGATAMSTGFGSRELPGLPRLLNQMDYFTSTYHVNDVKFWDRSKLYPALDFQKYYDKPYFNNDQYNEFGPSDEELFRVGMEHLLELDEQDQSVYAHYITVSNHSPFHVKEEFAKMTVPAELEGTHLGHYLQSVNYSDYALGKLIDALKENGLWDNTLLVVYGDHFGINPVEANAEMISSSLKIPYHEQISRFNIPLIMHVPGIEESLVVERVGGQVDILPTIANLLGISLEQEEFTAFGQDLLNIDHNLIGMRYYLPTGSFFNDDILFVPGDGFEDGTAVSLETMQPVEDISSYRSDYEYILQLMRLSDEYVKMLPKRSP